MRVSLTSVALSGLLLMAPVLASPQAAGRGGMPPAPMAGEMARGEGPVAGVTQILNARRQLDLSARQVAQLDSLERALHADRERVRAQIHAQTRPMADSLRARGRGGERPMHDDATSDQLRELRRQRMEAVRPQMEELRQRDSTARTAARQILTDDQRQKLREMEVERRGYSRGQRDARMGQHPNARFAPRQGAAPRPRMMFCEGRPDPRADRRPE